MNIKNIITAGVLGVSMLSLTNCTEKFAEINMDPSTVTQPNVPMLYTKGMMDTNYNDYGSWFYSARYTYTWAQAFVVPGGNGSLFNQHGATGHWSFFEHITKYAREVDYQLSQLPEEEAAQYKKLRASMDPIIAYGLMYSADMLGNRQFSKAYHYRYTGLEEDLTPGYDTVEEIYTQILEMLDNAIATLTDESLENQYSFTQNEPFYGGDVNKWARLANSLKLKVAVRLLHQDKARALQIAEQVGSSPVGVLTGTDDILKHNKGIRNFGEGNDVYNWIGSISKPVADFMVANLDPRVRFFSEKNDFNSLVVQAFYDSGNDLPPFIEANVESEMVDGKKMFKAWKGVGEPWVRYYGLPTEVDANLMPEYDTYFNSDHWRITIGETEKTFTPTSIYPEEYFRNSGRTFTVPTAPGGPVIEDKEQYPFYAYYMSSAEAYLYLAELKLLGANLPETAAEYFTQAITRSVTEIDYMADLNKIPYYSDSYKQGGAYGYDPLEETVNLKDGELDALLTKEAYQLTGSAAEQLEKVYLQQYLHFIARPTDQFASVRRSGVPMRGSKYLAWKDMAASTEIPRRYDFSEPVVTSQLYQIDLDNFAAQGFSTGVFSTPSLLNSERIWNDIGAPNFGEGPNF